MNENWCVIIYYYFSDLSIHLNKNFYTNPILFWTAGMSSKKSIQKH